MRKLISLFALAVVLLSCEVSTIDVASSPEMVSFYQESLTLKSVAPDSVQRFADKVNAYASNNPAAKEDPLYQEIQDNIGYIISFNIVVPGWDDVDVKY